LLVLAHTLSLHVEHFRWIAVWSWSFVLVAELAGLPVMQDA
jgi:hypothetical protein